MTPFEPVPLLSPADPMSVELGCLLGCRTSLAAGRMPVPFGSPADAAGVVRMAPSERDLVTAGLPLSGTAPGLSATVRLLPTLRLDAAAVVPGTGVVGGPMDGQPVGPLLPAPPDWAARAVWAPSAERGPEVVLGASSWVGSWRDRAFGLDLAVDTGWWTLRAEVGRQQIADVESTFPDTRARGLVAHDVSLGVDRELSRAWAVSSSVSGRAYDARKGRGPASWGRRRRGSRCARGATAWRGGRWSRWRRRWSTATSPSWPGSPRGSTSWGAEARRRARGEVSGGEVSGAARPR
jgi:hypothetical protein